MKTTKVKTSELTGIALNWAVAKCEGVAVTYDQMNRWYETVDPRHAHIDDPMVYAPTIYWEQAGEIIEREKITTINQSFPYFYTDCWAGFLSMPDGTEVFEYGSSPLEAAMRCYVASKLGDEVDIPDELN